MSKQSIEKIVASLELCKLIPAGEFEDTALVWRERIGNISRDDWVKFRAPEDISYKVESAEVNYFPAPTAEEIMEKLDAPGLWRGSDGKWRCFCKDHMSAQKGGTIADAVLRLWLKLKGIESK
ncbi:MAG: hypothetical protein ACI4UV_14820 [Victivallales bacterium]